MDTIKSYLNSMFASLPDTEEVRRAKEELLQMMEDKYSSLIAEGKTKNEAVGTVISEFGNLDELADSLGIGSFVHPQNTETNRRRITLQEVKDYLDSAKKSAYFLAVGVFFCITCVVPVIMMSAFSNCGLLPEKYTDALGPAMIFVFVAIGVALFILSSAKKREWEFLDTELCSLDGTEREYVVLQKKEFMNTYNVCLILGILLCVLSLVPVIVADGFGGSNADFLDDFFASFIFIFVGAGVLLLVMSSSRINSYKKLLEVNNMTTPNKNARRASSSKENYSNKTVAAVMDVFWPTVTCVYLIWSFLTFDWHITWIIWPIAGVASVLIKNLFGREEEF